MCAADAHNHEIAVLPSSRCDEVLGRVAHVQSLLETCGKPAYCQIVLLPARTTLAEFWYGMPPRVSTGPSTRVDAGQYEQSSGRAIERRRTSFRRNLSGSSVSPGFCGRGDGEFCQSAASAVNTASVCSAIPATAGPGPILAPSKRYGGPGMVTSMPSIVADRK